jgi:hypothetical protein
MAGRRHRRWMNDLLVGYVRVPTEQQASPPSATACTPSVSVMIASTSIMANRH